MRKSATRSVVPALAALILMPAAAVLAQGWQSRVQPAEGPQPKPAPAARAQLQQATQKATVEQPLQAQTQYLVRTALLTLNDANRSGNYTVLRDIAAPSFRDRNSAADLAAVFAELRRARLDLSIAALLSPELDGSPALDADRRLRLKGSCATEPNRIAFELVFEAVDGQWRLYGLWIATRPSRMASGGPATPPAR